ncbi:hypothetical protein CsatA_007963 [Cannabis sativa]
MEEKGPFGGVEPYWKNKRPFEDNHNDDDDDDDDELSKILMMNKGISSLPVWKKAHLMDYFGDGGVGSSSNEVPTKAFNTNITASSTTNNTLFSNLINENQGPKVAELIPSFCNTKESLDNRANDIQFRLGHNIDPNMDPRKMKRIISNRASSQRSRMKKAQYISDMENTVKALKCQILSLYPRVESYAKEYQLLQLEHNKLTHQISVYKDQDLLGQMEIEKNTTEVNRLRVLYKQQQQQLYEQQQQQFQASSMAHHEGNLSMNQIMSNFNTQPTEIFPHHPNPDIEFEGNNINGITRNYNPNQDQSTRSMMVGNTIALQHDDDHHVEDQTRVQSWMSTTTNFIKEPKQHDHHDIETNIQFYKNHFRSTPEYA